jgi:hypothetical protein
MEFNGRKRIYNTRVQAKAAPCFDRRHHQPEDSAFKAFPLARRRYAARASPKVFAECTGKGALIAKAHFERDL